MSEDKPGEIASLKKGHVKALRLEEKNRYRKACRGEKGRIRRQNEMGKAWEAEKKKRKGRQDGTCGRRRMKIETDTSTCVHLCAAGKCIFHAAKRGELKTKSRQGKKARGSRQQKIEERKKRACVGQVLKF